MTQVSPDVKMLSVKLLPSRPFAAHKEFHYFDKKDYKCNKNKTNNSNCLFCDSALYLYKKDKDDINFKILKARERYYYNVGINNTPAKILNVGKQLFKIIFKSYEKLGKQASNKLVIVQEQKSFNGTRIPTYAASHFVDDEDPKDWEFWINTWHDLNDDDLFPYERDLSNLYEKLTDAGFTKDSQANSRYRNIDAPWA